MHVTQGNTHKVFWLLHVVMEINNEFVLVFFKKNSFVFSITNLYSWAVGFSLCHNKFMPDSDYMQMIRIILGWYEEYIFSNTSEDC